MPLVKGSFISQALAIFFLPILSRMYSPEEFGVLASFFSIVSILVVFATCKYESAIFLTKSEKELLALLRLIYYFLGFFFILTITTAYVGYKFLGDYLRLDSEKLYYLVPFAVVINALFIVATNLLNKRAMYREISNSRVIQSLSSNIMSSVMFLLTSSMGLILGRIFGLLAGLFYLKKSSKKVPIEEKVVLKHLISKVFLKYINFLKYSTVSSALNIGSNYSLPLLLAIYFDYKVAGLYFMASKVIRIPISLVIGSVAKVFHKEAVQAYQNKASLLSIVRDTQRKIFISLALLMILVSIISPYFFGSILGESWSKAGEMVKYFAVLVVFRNTVSTTLMVFDIFNKQYILLIFNLILMLSQLLILNYSKYLPNFEITILCLSGVASLIYLAANILLFRVIRRYECS
jgi:O-antigen/teichoic acid export membrane protein